MGKALKKSCVLVKDAPGFVVNRLLTRFLGEVTAAFDEGTPFEVANSALDPLGLPMSPYVLLQLVGPAVALHTAETLHEAFPDRFGVSENQRRHGRGRQDHAARVGRLDPAHRRRRPRALRVRRLAVDRGAGAPARPRRPRARRPASCSTRASSAAPQDLDLCMLLGAGWPFHLGGITPYLDRTGTSERVTGQRFLPAGVASVS